jgi:acyl-CoA thioester hydrolase
VRYEIGLFAEGESLCAAAGHFVHVYVDRGSRRPVPELPSAYQQALKPLERP